MKRKISLALMFAVGFLIGCVSMLPPLQVPADAQSMFRLPSFYHGTVQVYSAAQTISETASRVETTGAVSFTLTLPPIANVPTGKEYNFKHVGTGVITLDGNALETIDGAATFTIPGQYYSVTIYKCGSSAQWCIQ